MALFLPVAQIHMAAASQEADWTAHIAVSCNCSQDSYSASQVEEHIPVMVVAWASATLPAVAVAGIAAVPGEQLADTAAEEQTVPVVAVQAGTVAAERSAEPVD
ncbi:MAG: hypothetical protein R2741_06105 [Methanolobus sp.]